VDFGDIARPRRCVVGCGVGGFDSVAMIFACVERKLRS